MKKRVECNITGRVQMVMFRDFTKRHARRLELAGLVKNNADGSVTVIAEGEENILHLLLQKLKKGPLLARVDRIDSRWKEPRGDFSQFDIVY